MVKHLSCGKENTRRQNWVGGCKGIGWVFEILFTYPQLSNHDFPLPSSQKQWLTISQICPAFSHLRTFDQVLLYIYNVLLIFTGSSLGLFRDLALILLSRNLFSFSFMPIATAFFYLFLLLLHIMHSWKLVKKLKALEVK